MTRHVTAEEQTPSQPAEQKLSARRPSRSAWFGLGLSTLGFFVFLVGIRPALFHLDRSPAIGFVQISVFTLGLGLLALGGYLSLRSMWRGVPISIAAEIGSRVIATGYVVAVFTGMADIFGFGSQPIAMMTPSFGEWQARGVELGELLIAIGFILMFRPPSALFAQASSPPSTDDSKSDDWDSSQQSQQSMR